MGKLWKGAEKTAATSLGVEARDEGFLDRWGGSAGGAADVLDGVEEGDAGADDELGAREAHGQVAEVLDAEGRWELGVVEREADLLPGFAAGDVVWVGQPG